MLCVSISLTQARYSQTKFCYVFFCTTALNDRGTMCLHKEEQAAVDNRLLSTAELVKTTPFSKNIFTKRVSSTRIPGIANGITPCSYTTNKHTIFQHMLVVILEIF